MRVAVVDNADAVVVAWDTPKLARVALADTALARLDSRFYGRKQPDRETLLRNALDAALLSLFEETR